MIGLQTIGKSAESDFNHNLQNILLSKKTYQNLQLIRKSLLSHVSVKSSDYRKNNRIKKNKVNNSCLFQL